MNVLFYIWLLKFSLQNWTNNTLVIWTSGLIFFLKLTSLHTFVVKIHYWSYFSWASWVLAIVAIVYWDFAPRSLLLTSEDWMTKFSASLYLPRLLRVTAKFSMAKMVWGCCTPRILFLASRTWISSCSASMYFPRSRYVPARFAMAKIVFGCSTPRILFLASRTWIPSFSALCIFPGFHMSLLDFPW